MPTQPTTNDQQPADQRRDVDVDEPHKTFCDLCDHKHERPLTDHNGDDVDGFVYVGDVTVCSVCLDHYT